MAQATQQIDIVLFDLGGVLVELTGVPTFLGWLDQQCSADDLWHRWLHSPAVRRFELGRSSAEEFAQEIVKEFTLPVPVDTFLAEFTVWPRNLYPGVIPLLDRLSATHTLACFSNNNVLHWDRICTGMGLGRYFTHHFASHLIGYLKPDREAFEFVRDALGCPAGHILFLDDNRLNVEAARDVGMQARRTVGFDEVPGALAEFGILLPSIH